MHRCSARCCCAPVEALRSDGDLLGRLLRRRQKREVRARGAPGFDRDCRGRGLEARLLADDRISARRYSGEIVGAFRVARGLRRRMSVLRIQSYLDPGERLLLGISCNAAHLAGGGLGRRIGRNGAEEDAWQKAAQGKRDDRRSCVREVFHLQTPPRKSSMRRRSSATARLGLSISGGGRSARSK